MRHTKPRDASDLPVSKCDRTSARNSPECFNHPNGSARPAAAGRCRHSGTVAKRSDLWRLRQSAHKCSCVAGGFLRYSMHHRDGRDQWTGTPKPTRESAMTTGGPRKSSRLSDHLGDVPRATARGERVWRRRDRAATARGALFGKEVIQCQVRSFRGCAADRSSTELRRAVSLRTTYGRPSPQGRPVVFLRRSVHAGSGSPL